MNPYQFMYQLQNLDGLDGFFDTIQSAFVKNYIS